MNNKIKKLTFFLIFCLIVNCSFDNKTGIWSGSEEEKRRAEEERKKKVLSDDDLIDNYSFQVGGYNFLEPRFYFSRKRKDREKDIKDWNGIKNFFERENHKGYPFNKLSDEQLGKQFV